MRFFKIFDVGFYIIDNRRAAHVISYEVIPLVHYPSNVTRDFIYFDNYDGKVSF